MRFVLEIECDNDAFVGRKEEEVAKVLEQAARALRVGYPMGYLSDINGNKVGAFKFIGAKKGGRT